MPAELWQKCLGCLQGELPSQQFNTWIKPLQVEPSEPGELCLKAPNRFVLNWVSEKYLDRLHELLSELSDSGSYQVKLVLAARQASTFSRQSERPSLRSNDVASSANSPLDRDEHDYAAPKPSGSKPFDTVDNSLSQPSAQPYTAPEPQPAYNSQPTNLNLPIDEVTPYQSEVIEPPPTAPVNNRNAKKVKVDGGLNHEYSLNSNFTFSSFVEGKSNQLGMAAAAQVAENPGGAYNPLFIYGGVGLGKTHLMHAVGNALLAKDPNAKVVYLHSERFVADMVKALQLNAINDFKRYYRSVNALLIDDIQFFAGKERSQEEFFHTFNALLEGGQQVILTSDRYPKEINGLEERLKSRFGWGLTVAIEPPELETRVAILMKKAEQARIHLPQDAAFFIAQRVRSNVRELEGALKRVIASAHFTQQPIDVMLVREALKDLLALQDKQVNIDNIQRVVAEYYKIKIPDLLSKRRSRSVARPRQVAMALAKELTNHSLPEIGEAFGGRDHTTVLHLSLIHI